MSAKNKLTKIWVFAKSMKLAITLIALVTASVTVNILMLAKRWTVSAAGLGGQNGDIYRYWWFQVLIFLLMFNLLVCTANNAFSRIKARSGNLSLWGSTIFHAGLVIILMGTLVTGSFRVLCTIKLIQGEVKQIPYQALTTEANSEQYPKDLSLTLMEQEKEFAVDSKLEQHNETGLSSESEETYSTIRITDSAQNTVERRLAGQEEVFYKGIYMFPNRYGYAVNLAVSHPGADSAKGQQADNVTVAMETNDYGNGIKAYTLNGYTTREMPFSLSFIFYPDLSGKEASGRFVNRSSKLANPALYVRTSGTGITPAEKIIWPGQSIDVQGYRITFKGAKPWSELTSVFDPGARLVFFGIIMAIAGLTVFSLFGSHKFTMARSVRRTSYNR